MLRCATILFAIAFLLAPAFAQPPASSPALEPAQTPEPFGEEVMLTGKPMVFIAGRASWDKAWPTLIGNFKTISAFLARQKMAPAGAVMTIYLAVKDTGFEYQAAVPLAAAPAKLPRGVVTAGQSPVGKAIKFGHRGSYESMEMLYEAINNYLDGKGIEKQGLFYEEYVTDPLTTPEDKLVVNVYVMVK